MINFQESNVSIEFTLLRTSLLLITKIQFVLETLSGEAPDDTLAGVRLIVHKRPEILFNTKVVK